MISLYARLIGVAALLVLLAGFGWKLRHNGLVAGRTEVRAEWTAATLAASETARLREQAAQKANERVDHEYQASKNRLAADKRITDASLRSLQAAVKQPDSVASTSSSSDDPRDTIIDSCAAALVGMDEYAKGVALTAVGLQGYAREVCVNK